MEVEMLVPACLNTISVLYTRVSEPKVQKEYNQEYFVYTCLQLIWSCMISFEFRGYVVQDQIPYAVLVSQSHSLRR